MQVDQTTDIDVLYSHTTTLALNANPTRISPLLSSYPSFYHGTVSQNELGKLATSLRLSLKM